MSTVIINDEYDSDLELFEQRNQQIQQLKSEQLKFKEQLLKHIANKDYECNLVSPIPYPFEKNTEHQQNDNSNLLILNKSHDLSNRSQNNCQNSSQRNQKPKIQGNYLLKQGYINKTPIKKSSQQISYKINKTNNAIVQNQKSPSNFSTCEQKSSRTPEQPSQISAIQSPITYKNYLKKDYEKKSREYNLSFFTNKTKNERKKDVSNPKLKTEPKLKTKTEITNIQKSKSPIEQPKKGFECWYNSQKQWLQQTQEKIFKQRLQIEQDIQEQETFSYSPDIQEGSRFIVQQKYNNASILERQKYYQEEKQYRDFQKQLREEEDRQINKIRISPLSRQIIASPKSNYSFTICNSSNQNYSTIIKK